VFREGDKVSYPHHGAAVVVERAERMVFGERRAYLKLRLRHGDLTLMVPVDRTGQVGLRPVATKGQIEEVLHLLQTAEGAMPTLWRLRHRANLAKVASGNILQVAEVVRDLDGRSRRSGLSHEERRMLFKARELLVSELAVAWDSTDEYAEATLDEVLEPPR
jgi:CarD family transcriptional regulator